MSGALFNPTRLVCARHRRGMTRWELAGGLGLPSVAALGRIERGEKDPGDEMVERIAAVLNWPVGFFYRDDLPELGTIL